MRVTVVRHFKFVPFLLSLILPFLSEAQTLGRIQGTRAVVQFPGSVAVGDEFYVLGADNKRAAIVRVTRIQGNKGVVELVRGKWTQGARLQAKGKASGGTASQHMARGGESSGETGDRWAGGVTAGYAMHSFTMTAKGSGLEVPTDMKGSGFAISGAVDVPITPSFILRGKAGLDSFNVSSTVTSENSAVCTDSTSCSIQFSYLSFDGQIIWKLSEGSMVPFLLGGYNFLMANSGKTTVTNFDATVKTNSSFVLGGGLEFKMSRDSFVPLELGYKLYQTSGEIKANVISSGYMFYF